MSAKSRLLSIPRAEGFALPPQLVGKVNKLKKTDFEKARAIVRKSVRRRTKVRQDDFSHKASKAAVMRLCPKYNLIY
jgi:hypothetical protein